MTDILDGPHREGIGGSSVMEGVALLALQRQGVPWIVPDFLADLCRERFGPDPQTEPQP